MKPGFPGILLMATKMKLIAGNSNRPLAEAVAKHLGIALTQSSIRRFSDKEIFVEILENVRGEDTFVIQPTSFPTNDSLMELLIIIDTLRRASARRITAVIPYYGYGRQDRKTGPRTPITAKLVANLITMAGAHRVLTLDLHAGQIQGFFDIPLDNLYVAPIFVRDIRDVMKERKKSTKDLTIVSPDTGGVSRARALAKRLEAELAIADKRREKAGVSEVMNIIGDVEGRECLLFDDMVDSAGTLCNAAIALLDKGAKSVAAYATHGVLSGKAVERVEASPLKSLTITDSILATPEVAAAKKIRQLSIAPLLAETLLRISEERSVSSLFD
jgi:ribose-phosphate pyrophosphokinase